MNLNELPAGTGLKNSWQSITSTSPADFPAFLGFVGYMVTGMVTKMVTPKKHLYFLIF